MSWSGISGSLLASEKKIPCCSLKERDWKIPVPFPCSHTVRVIFSLSPDLLISDYSRFMFPRVPRFGTVRYSHNTAWCWFPAHQAQGLFTVLRCIGSNVNTNALTLHRSEVFWYQMRARADAGGGRSTDIHHIFALSWLKGKYVPGWSLLKC